MKVLSEQDNTKFKNLIIKHRISLWVNLQEKIKSFLIGTQTHFYSFSVRELFDVL